MTEAKHTPTRILNGDHAEFEREHTNTPPQERPDWPVPSFDAADWAAAFCKIANENGFKDTKGELIDEGWMITWFANALMRGFDEHAARAAPEPPAHGDAGEKIVAPFTAEQVDALNAWQALGYVHEFTCPGDNDHPADKPRKLVATSKGWFCPWCAYRQDWAHAFMANKAKHPRNPIETLRAPAHDDAVVERVAKALARQFAETHDHVTKPDGFVAGWWKEFSAEARAAIAAMPAQSPLLNEAAEVLREADKLINFHFYGDNGVLVKIRALLSKLEGGLGKPHMTAADSETTVESS